MNEKSKAFELIEFVWNNEKTDSYLRVNIAMYEAVKLAIISQMKFNKEDFQNIFSKFSGGYWFGVNANGKGCSLCKGTGWIEVLGAGVVNKKVLEGCGIDTNEYSGFAFGIGLERIAMLKYGINNIKLLFESDLRVLDQIDDN